MTATAAREFAVDLERKIELRGEPVEVNELEMPDLRTAQREVVCALRRARLGFMLAERAGQLVLVVFPPRENRLIYDAPDRRPGSPLRRTGNGGTSTRRDAWRGSEGYSRGR